MSGELVFIRGVIGLVFGAMAVRLIHWWRFR